MNSPAHDELVEDIQATREQLGATVEELAHRLDVKAQVDEKVAETKAAVHDKVAETKDTVQTKVAETKDTVQTKVAETKDTVAAKVTDVKETVVAKAAVVKDTVAAKVHSDKPAQSPEPVAAKPGPPTIETPKLQPTHIAPASPGPVSDTRARVAAAAGRRDVQTAAGVAGLAATLAAILLRKA